MARWTIYDKSGNAKALTGSVTVGHRTMPELEYSGTWMGECFVTLTVKSEQPVNWQLGDYVMYRNEKFVLNYDPSVIKQAKSNTYGEAYVYENVKFNSLAIELTDVQFLDVVLNDNHIHYTSLPSFSFFANDIDDLADRLQANVNRYCRENGFAVADYWLILTSNRTRSIARAGDVTGLAPYMTAAWNANYSQSETYATGKYNQNVQVSSQSVSQMLAVIKSSFDLNFVSKGRQIIIGAAAREVEHIFRYGKGNGLYEIERVVDSEQQVITKLIAYGGNTNLPTRYYADINKQCFAYVQGVNNGYLVLDIPFTHTKFNGEADTSFPPNSAFYVTVVDKNNASFYGKVVDDKWLRGTLATGNCCLVIDSQTSYSVGDKFTFSSGVVPDKWDSGHFSYINEGMVLPDNLAVNNLMLPGFPTQSLYDWVIDNGGSAVTDSRNNDSYGRATWVYSGETHEAFFSKDKLNPYILSLNFDTVGVREYTKFFDGSDGTEDIHPSIENTSADHLLSADVITDNGVFENEDKAPNFHVTIPSLGVNVEFNSLLKSDTTISMKDGYCGGRDFVVKGATKNQNGTWNVTLQRHYEESLQIYFPYSDKASRGETAVANEAYQLRGSDISGYDGDKFVIIGIDMPDTYIESSAAKLLSYSLVYLSLNDYVRYTYSPKVDEIYMAKEHNAATASTSLHDTLKEGDLMQFEDTDLNIDGNVFIDTLHIKEYGNNGIPTYDVTLKETKTVGTIERIKQQIDSLSGGGSNGSSAQGLSSSQVKSLINSYGDERFIRRDINDETDTDLTTKNLIAKEAVKTDKIQSKMANAPVTVDNDLVVNEDLVAKGDVTLGDSASDTTEVKGTLVDKVLAILNQIKSDDFNAGDSSAFRNGFLLTKTDANGKSYLEVDNLFVRLKAIFTELEIRKISYAGGNIVFSHAGSNIVKVVPLYTTAGASISGSLLTLGNAARVSGNILELDGNASVEDNMLILDNSTQLLYAYRCYIKKDDGTTATENWWKLNDQARCQTFNIDETGTYHNVENSYYWRRVIGVGTEKVTLQEGQSEENYDYVDLSAIDCDSGSTVPQEGDNIVQMGNRTDVTRQGFISIEVWSNDGNAPAFRVYKDVTSYTLENKQKIVISPKNTELTVQKFHLETDSGVVPMTKYRGEWNDIENHQCYYYDEVTHNGSTWVCTYPESGIGGVKYTTEEPSDSATYWEIKVQKGTDGRDGQDGKSFNILGSYDTVEELEAAHPTGEVGQAYIVAGHLYIWDEENSEWHDSGQIKGDKGDTGNGIASATISYGVSPSSSTLPEEWKATESELTLQQGYYLFTRIVFTYTNGSSATSYSVARQGVDGSYKSTVFTRSNKDLSSYQPTGGSSQSPKPNDGIVSGETIIWSDGIPDGEAKVWSTSSIFKADGTHTTWSMPKAMTDTETFDVEFAVEQTNDGKPATPTANNRHKDAYPYGYDGQVWFDPVLDKYSASGVERDFTQMWWRAERSKKNGEYSDWTIERIKGEKGEQGEQGDVVQLLASPSLISITTDSDGKVIEDFEKEIELNLFVSGDVASLDSVTVNESGTSYITYDSALHIHPWVDAEVSGTLLTIPSGTIQNTCLTVPNDGYAVAPRILKVKVAKGTTLTEKDIQVTATGYVEEGKIREALDIIRIQRQYWVQKPQFTSMVFKRSSSKPSTPEGGTYESPVPEGWSDGIESGTGALWASTCVFFGDGTTSGWSEPVQQIDTDTLDIEFSASETEPNAPTGDTPFADHTSEGWYDPSNLPSGVTMIWRAERKVKNSAYDGAWVVSRIYGEKGETGDTGAAGANGIDISLDKSTILFTQDVSDTSVVTPASPTVEVKVNDGGTPVTSGVTVACTGGTHYNYNNVTISGRTITIPASAIQTYTEGTKTYLYENGDLTFKVTYKSKDYTIKLSWLLNAIGKFKTTIEGDVETSIASKHTYYLNSDGTALESEVDQQGTYIRSAEENIQRLDEQVNDPTTGLEHKYSEISHNVNKISLKVGQYYNLFYNAFFGELLAERSPYSQTTSISLVSEGTYGGKVIRMGGGYFNETITSSIMGSDTKGYGVYLDEGTYTFQMYAKVQTSYPSTGFAGVELLWDDNADFSTWSSSKIIQRIQVTETSYSRYTYTFTLASARYVGFRMILDGISTGGTSFFLYVDAVMLEIGSTASSMVSSYGGNQSGAEVGRVQRNLLATGIDIEEKKITMTADKFICQNNSGQKTAWLDNLGNFTIRGVYNNLITIITQNNWTNYIIKQDNKYYLDVLRVGYYVRINSLPSEMQEQKIQLPYYGNSGSEYKCRGYTRYDTGEVHQMSADELKMLTGKRMVIDINFDNNMFLHTSIGDTWYPHVYYGSNSPTDYQKEQVMRATMNGRRRYLTLTNDTMNIRKTFTLGVKNTIFMEMALVQFHASQTDSSFSYGYIWLGDADTSAASHDDIDW